MEITCQACGKKFKPKTRNKNAKYCCRECADKGRITKIKLECENCGKEYEVIACRVMTSKYCCRKCADESKIAKPNVKCSYCGKDFHRSRSGVNRSKENYCSIECHRQAKKQYMYGENNHQHGLKGELNSSYKSDYRISEYGYLLVRDVLHPFRTKNSDMIFFHRKLVEEYLRESLPDSEYLIDVDDLPLKYLDPAVEIHHKNHDKLDNRLSNLEILDKSDHMAIHSELLVYERDCLGRFVKTEPLILNQSKIKKEHLDDAGYDIFSDEDFEIQPGGSKIVKTNLFMGIPKGYVGLIWPKSGLSVKYGIDCGAGCIDCGYTGEIKVLLRNFSDNVFYGEVGDKIAQILLVPININKIKNVNSLNETERGANGFGSTGIK